MQVDDRGQLVGSQFSPYKDLEDQFRPELRLGLFVSRCPPGLPSSTSQGLRLQSGH